jgi:hypothetical protein
MDQAVIKSIKEKYFKTDVGKKLILNLYE